MIKICIGFAAASAMLLLTGCAADGQEDRAAAGRSAASQGRDCFLPSQVSGFSRATDESVIVTTGPSDYYRLETFGTCPDLDFRQTIGIRSTGGSSWICSGLDAELIVPATLGPQRCAVRNIRKLGEAEAKALRSGKGG